MQHQQMLEAQTRGKNMFFEYSIPDFNIWTDGSCPRAGGPGGWAFVVTYDSHKRDLITNIGRGPLDNTTSNIAELKAIYWAMRYIQEKEPGAKALILTDSMHSHDLITEHMWVWEHLGWQTKQGQEVKNLELIQSIKQLIEEQPRQFKLMWVKGHSGLLFNELADTYARRMTLRFE